MNTHVDKTQENVHQSVSRRESNGQGNTSASFVDNRPEMVAQRKLQEIVNNSPVIAQLKAYQEMADNRTQPQLPIQKKANATGLPDNLKSGMENLSGFSLDDVKVHRNSDKPAQLQAHAYAQGSDIHLASGQEKHLPHEAWHVVQQKQGRVKPAMQMKGKVNVNDDQDLEREADVMGMKALKTSHINKAANPMVNGFGGGNIVQRVLSAQDKTRLVPLIGTPKFKILSKPEYDNAQDKLKVMSDARLSKLKTIEISTYTEMLVQLNEEDEADIEENIEHVGQRLELGGALLEPTGSVLSVLGMGAETLGGGISAGLDMGAETLGGGISAGLDMRKGVKGLQKGKTAEGGSLLTSGLLGGVSAIAGMELLPSLSSVAGFIPGVPDLFATASATSKFYSGYAQSVNTKSNLASLESLENNVAGNQVMLDAINMLAAKNSFYDAYKTMGLASVEGVASLLGSWPKYLGIAFSKGFEPAEKLYGAYAETKAEESQEVTTSREKSALSLAVKNTTGMNNRYDLLGRLYKIAKLTDDNLAEVMMKAADTLPPSQKASFKNKCK
jgi:hypothetical protein